MKLTIKQKKFIDEYIISGNKTKAYKKAGYKATTDKVANSNAIRLLENERVKNHLNQRLVEIEDKQIAKQEEILRYLTSVLRGSSKSEVIVVEGIGEGHSEARRIHKTPDEKERIKAAELLGKRYGTWTEKVDMSGDMNLRIEVDYGDEDSE